jgi:hypothetical protein
MQKNTDKEFCFNSLKIQQLLAKSSRFHKLLNFREKITLA